MAGRGRDLVLEVEGERIVRLLCYSALPWRRAHGPRPGEDRTTVACSLLSGRNVVRYIEIVRGSGRGDNAGTGL